MITEKWPDIKIRQVGPNFKIRLWGREDRVFRKEKWTPNVSKI